MANSQLESQVINHLEFHGYEVNPATDAKPGEATHLRAMGPSGGMNLWLEEWLVSFSRVYSLKDSAMTDKLGLFEVVNDLNRRFETQYYIDEEGETSVFIHGLTYRGPYDKKAFARFVTTWEKEIEALWGTGIGQFLR